jgi:hypothetical protein
MELLPFLLHQQICSWMSSFIINSNGSTLSKLAYYHMDPLQIQINFVRDENSRLSWECQRYQGIIVKMSWECQWFQSVIMKINDRLFLFVHTKGKIFIQFLTKFVLIVFSYCIEFKWRFILFLAIDLIYKGNNKITELRTIFLF